MGLILNYAVFLALASAVAAQSCAVVSEGRIPKDAKPSLFDDVNASPFDTELYKASG